LVHPTFTDGCAKITRKTKPDFAASQALTGFGVDLQNLLPDVLSYFLVYIKILRFPNCAWAV
ncbi:hypothetical protein, partial [Anaerotruncus colihominis]|uniref:hypothetical protein n=1 Tax=Anaerotruncus colihominis TaxID=169435 RepID=UPI002943C793